MPTDDLAYFCPLFMRLKLTNKTARISVAKPLWFAALLFVIPLIAQSQPISLDSVLLPPSALNNYAFDYGCRAGAESTFNKQGRIRLVAGLNVVVYTGTLLALNEAWYKGYDRTSFHTFNDSREWQQVDKVGHAWSAYNLGKYSTDLWKWAGLPHKKAVWIGGLSGAAYLTVIELLDAHSARWGWSWADMGANILGSGMFISQALGWKEQRIQFKFSFHRTSYESAVTPRVDDLFGSSIAARTLKDYNGQTYWLSANLKSFFRESRLPAWLNVSVGYGAEGMLGGFENKWTNDDGSTETRHDISRYRQFYLAPDIDLTKIKTRKKSIRTVLNILNAIKFPAPTLEFSNGKVKGHWLYF